MATSYQGSLQDIANRVDIYKRNPTLIQRAILDYLTEVTDGEISIVDATNPFVFLLEASAVNTATAINQADINLRKQYAALSVSDEDIMRHLSDKEIMNRFSSPLSVEFTFIFLFEDFRKNMVYSPEERQHKVVIPRDTYITVNNTVYTLSYPITIALHDAGGMKISYDNEIPSPIEALTTNNIVPTMRTTAEGVQIVYFKAKVKQLELTKKEWTVERKAVFRQNLAFHDKFYYARAFHKGSEVGSQWVEISTTHNEQVYDLNKPTVCFKVLDGSVDIYIPHVYIMGGLIGSTVRIDLYTTKGSMSVDYREYEVGAFSTTLRAIDPRSESIFTTSAANIGLQAFSTDVADGGSDGISFETLRERTIYHANGEITTPVTTAQLESKLESSGFQLVPFVDTLTSRIFYATRSLPRPNNKKLLSAVNITIGTTIVDSLRFENSPYIRVNAYRTTLLPKNLYENVNGIISMVPYSKAAQMLSGDKTELIVDVNSKNYLYTPYYYVLDSGNSEYDVRAYDLDRPDFGEINFVAQNDTMQMPVNSTNTVLMKVENGYELYFKTSSGSFYQNAADGDVGMQIGFYPPGEGHMAYINAELYATNPQDNERVWKVFFETNYDLDRDDNLTILNARMFVDEPLVTTISLDTVIHMFHHTTSVTSLYIPDATDSLLGKFMLPEGTRAITHESLPIKFGDALRKLWKRARAIPVDQEYQRYEQDIPLVYDRDIYNTDANGVIFAVVDGQVMYDVLHKAGDPVLDNKGEQVYKHRVGDVVLDLNGQPMIKSSMRRVHEVDLLFFDGVMYFVTDETMLNYRKQVSEIITDWVVDDLEEIDKTLLDRTGVFFYPKSMLGKVQIKPTNDSDAIINAEQSLVVDLYVTKEVYDDQTVRDLIRSETIRILDDHIGRDEVNMVSAMEDLRATYDNGVISFKVSGLGGNRNYSVLRVVNKENRLCINKRLAAQPDGFLVVEDDVTVNFIRYQ